MIPIRTVNSGWNTPLTSYTDDQRRHAEVAQLVERNLAKVEVAGSNPVFRSTGRHRHLIDARGSLQRATRFVFGTMATWPSG